MHPQKTIFQPAAHRTHAGRCPSGAVSNMVGGASGAQRGRFLASPFPNLSRNPRSSEALRPASGKPSGRMLYFLPYIHSRSTPKPSLRPFVIRTFVIDSSLGISSFGFPLSRTPQNVPRPADGAPHHLFGGERGSFIRFWIPLNAPFVFGRKIPPHGKKEHSTDRAAPRFHTR